MKTIKFILIMAWIHILGFLYGIAIIFLWLLVTDFQEITADNRVVIMGIASWVFVIIYGISCEKRNSSCSHQSQDGFWGFNDSCGSGDYGNY